MKRYSAGAMAEPENDGWWVFGYGSLIWRPDIPYVEQAPGWIAGWRRRFWQGSTDHRGTPEAPGRVVTLVDAPGERCWGRAFALPDDRKHDILAALDHREQGGYQRLALPLQFADGRQRQGLTWIATAENANYLGPAGDEEIARQVVASAGPSGPNHEYVLRLDQALRDDEHDDPHVRGIAEHVRALLA